MFTAEITRIEVPAAYNTGEKVGVTPCGRVYVGNAYVANVIKGFSCYYIQVNEGTKWDSTEILDGDTIEEVCGYLCRALANA